MGDLRWATPRDNASSEDWKYLAQQMAAAYKAAYYKRDKDGKLGPWGLPESCVAALEAIHRASTYGMGA